MINYAFLNETKTSKNKKSKFGAGIFILADFLPNFITFTSFGMGSSFWFLFFDL